jgi:hypothetical protein
MQRLDLPKLVLLAIVLALIVWLVQYVIRSNEVVCNDGTGHECVTPGPAPAQRRRP